MSYAYQRADLVSALAMADGRERAKALDDFDMWVNAPLEGWDAVDKRLQAELMRGDDG